MLATLRFWFTKDLVGKPMHVSVHHLTCLLIASL